MLLPGEDFDFFNPYSKVEMKESNLPHWTQPRVLYFVTFRLADSLPKQKLDQWRIELKNWLSKNPMPWNESQANTYQKEFANHIEHWLDAGHGSCLLANETNRQIVEDCILKFNGERYALDAYTVAVNHVHALVVPFFGQPLSSILKGWKGVSARRIHQAGNTKASIWQKESYDHIVRNQVSLDRIRAYIRNHKK